jgi:uncharacterized protein (DUF1800 family)
VVERLLDDPAEAERQLAVGDGGDLRAVAADLVERTAAWRRPGGTRHQT